MSISRTGTDAVDAAELRERLASGLAAMAPVIAETVDETARGQLVKYVQLLTRWNRAYNLTAVRDPREQVPRHLLDSLAVLPWVVRGPVLDLGTGAGLPGIPLAIARPRLAFTLLDSNGKKTRFVRQVVLELGLKNVVVVQARLEAYQPEQKFATIVARALSSLASLWVNARGLAIADGRLLALKGPLAEDELAALMARADVDSEASSSVSAGVVAQPRIHPLVVPGVDGERSLIEVPLGGSTHG
ncbi:MAG: 16S rRNA (guanine(527)-N(7))-methyltransferase RsmG [Lamprobacter sp.]|uniref:16S rRNA (guanine(527)-N(7))-methyltransferase RsmG n=1 Tax=Lamprobacter sp. TaxID=3100796 RepID=UPI002B25B47E|nr:16S rRNA (guanine(527)-N(7))-methyltransferase RsmG [Lamprobacter sp.]MEA3638717.1 16S rRNA (guanine(527)-N(7))-methyltransferase RsmG [Lamprobacter sp.]